MKYPASIRCCNIEPNGPIIYNENRLIHLPLHASTFHYFEGINSSILSSKPRKIGLDLLIGSKYLKFDSNEIQNRFSHRFFHRSGSNIEETLRVTISLVHLAYSFMQQKRILYRRIYIDRSNNIIIHRVEKGTEESVFDDNITYT